MILYGKIEHRNLLYYPYYMVYDTHIWILPILTGIQILNNSMDLLGHIGITIYGCQMLRACDGQHLRWLGEVHTNQDATWMPAGCEGSHMCDLIKASWSCLFWYLRLCFHTENFAQAEAKKITRGVIEAVLDHGNRRVESENVRVLAAKKSETIKTSMNQNLSIIFSGKQRVFHFFLPKIYPPVN